MTIKCRGCSSNNCIKSGKPRGIQRYLCKDCGRQFLEKIRHGVHPALKELAVVLYSYCGCSMRSIGRIFGVSTVAVLKWIRAAAAKIQETPISASAYVIIDEMWHFINGKKTKIGYGEPFVGCQGSLADGTLVTVLISR